MVAFVPMRVPEVKWRIAVLGFEFRGLIVDFGFWRMWFWILDFGCLLGELSAGKLAKQLLREVNYVNLRRKSRQAVLLCAENLAKQFCCAPKISPSSFIVR